MKRRMGVERHAAMVAELTGIPIEELLGRDGEGKYVDVTERRIVLAAQQARAERIARAAEADSAQEE